MAAHPEMDEGPEFCYSYHRALSVRGPFTISEDERKPPVFAWTRKNMKPYRIEWYSVEELYLGCSMEDNHCHAAYFSYLYPCQLS